MSEKSNTPLEQMQMVPDDEPPLAFLQQDQFSLLHIIMVNPQRNVFNLVCYETVRKDVNLYRPVKLSHPRNII
jgi:hypothetical protein